MFLINSTKSFLKGISSFTCLGMYHDFSPYHLVFSSLLSILSLLWLNFFLATWYCRKLNLELAITSLFFRLALIWISQCMGKLVSVFSCIWTKCWTLSSYRKIQIRESPYFIIFQALLNFICCGGPTNAFIKSTSRFFWKLV